jgi:hypothetical protein
MEKLCDGHPDMQKPHPIHFDLLTVIELPSISRVIHPPSMSENRVCILRVAFSPAINDLAFLKTEEVSARQD